MDSALARKKNINRARGLLVVIFAAYFYYLHFENVTANYWTAGLLFFCYLGSWIFFQMLPAKHYSKLNLQRNSP